MRHMVVDYCLDINGSTWTSYTMTSTIKGITVSKDNKYVYVLLVSGQVYLQRPTVTNILGDVEVLSVLHY